MPRSPSVQDLSTPLTESLGTPDSLQSYLGEVLLLDSTVSELQAIHVRHHTNSPYSVIQLLKLSGFSPIIAYAASKHTDDLKALGATHIIDRNITPLSDLTSSVQNITTDPIKLVFDTVTSLEAQQAGYDVLSSGGTLSTLHPIKVKNITEDKAAVFIMGSVTMSPPHRAFGKEVLFKYLQTLLEDGTIQVCRPS